MKPLAADSSPAADPAREWKRARVSGERDVYAAAAWRARGRLDLPDVLVACGRLCGLKAALLVRRAASLLAGYRRRPRLRVRAASRRQYQLGARRPANSQAGRLRCPCLRSRRREEAGGHPEHPRHAPRPIRLLTSAATYRRRPRLRVRAASRRPNRLGARRPANSQAGRLRYPCAIVPWQADFPRQCAPAPPPRHLGGYVVTARLYAASRSAENCAFKKPEPSHAEAA